jgi:glyoxylase-like metal-dependent hydrolase (beta-lactamase superfamily II)
LRIADRWFDRKTLGDGIQWLTEPYAHPLIRCNIWFVQGRDSSLLVDTGLGVASLRDAIADQMGSPLVAVATHVHYDHVGGLHEFEDRRIHPLEAEQMADYSEFHALRRSEFPDFAVTALETAGYVLDAEFLLDAFPSTDFDPDAYSIRSTRPTSTLEEGEIVDLGDRNFEVLHLPGHTPGSIGLYERASETLFSGDAIYDGPLVDMLPESDIVAYAKTLKRLRELPVRVVHGGHEPSFAGDRLIEIIDDYLNRWQA